MESQDLSIFHFSTCIKFSDIGKKILYRIFSCSIYSAGINFNLLNMFDFNFDFWSTFQVKNHS